MRYFKLINPLTLPRTLAPGMGNTHKRPKAGDVVAVSDDACARDSRFVRGRKRARDWSEITEEEYSAATATATAAPQAASIPASAPIITGGPTVNGPPVASTTTTEQPAAPAKAK